MLSGKILNEKIYASKNSRAGYLGAFTRVQGQIESLLSTTDNIQTVQNLVKRYHDAWCNFERAHIDYLSLVDCESLSFKEAVEQFSQKYEAKKKFLESVWAYLGAHEITNFFQSRAKLFKDKIYEYAESTTSHRSNMSMIEVYDSDFTTAHTLLKHAQMVGDVRNSTIQESRLMWPSSSKKKKFKWSVPKNFQTPWFVLEDYTSHWNKCPCWVRSFVFMYRI